jgi:hypothetical protein
MADRVFTGHRNVRPAVGGAVGAGARIEVLELLVDRVRKWWT